MSRKAANDFFERISGDVELKKALRLLLKDKATEDLMPALVGFARRLGFYFKAEEFTRVLWSKVEIPVEEKPDPYAHVLRGFFHHYAPAPKVDESVPLLPQNTNQEIEEDGRPLLAESSETSADAPTDNSEQGS